MEEAMIESQVNELQQRLLSFCNQLAKDEDDPVREQIKELCALAKTGLLELNNQKSGSKDTRSI